MRWRMGLPRSASAAVDLAEENIVWVGNWTREGGGRKGWSSPYRGANGGDDLSTSVAYSRNG